MVQIGTPEEYFGSRKEIVIAEPVPTKMVEPIEAKVIEPVSVTQLQDNNMPLILAICFLGLVSIGLVIVLGIHAWRH